MLIDHVPGEHFRRHGYSLQDLTDTMRQIARDDGVYMTPRTLLCIQEHGLNPEEVERGVQDGAVVEAEVPPHRWEIRLEVKPPRGDAGTVALVVWLSKEHKLYCEDIRPDKIASGRL